MPSLHRARIVAIGTREDMIRLNRQLLLSHDWLQEEEEGPEKTLEQLYEDVHQRARWEGSEDCGFVYDMVAAVPFGNAYPDQCRYHMRQESCGLWTATFSYEGDTTFQPEDWLNLHNRCGRVPMLALRASWDFAHDKGLMIFTGGHIVENWDRMAECWLWILHQYEFGYPPEEAVARLAKLEKTMEREDCDLTVEELLECCAENLRTLEDVSDITPESLQQALENRDFALLFEMYARVAETCLWETEHNARWLACIESVKQAWQKYQEG